ncbi:MAG: MFS transporter [Pseudomonadota bacterium]
MKRSPLAWAFYDWANSAFATVVMAGFFPLFFKQYWADSLSTADSTFWLGVVNSGASLTIVVLAPILGALADQSGRKKGFLLIFALLGIVMTCGLSLAAQGAWLMAMLFYLLAVIGFMGANVFYDALLLNVISRNGQESDRVSALGFALGYLGGGLLFALCVLMTQQPQWFQLADTAAAVKTSFFLVGIWWALFSIPIMLFVQEEKKTSPPAVLQSALKRVVSTVRELKVLRAAALFLFAYWLYIDGVGTVVRMAIDYGISIGFDSNHLIIALLITQLIGFPATLVYGRLTRYLDIRTGILIGIAVYCLVTVWGSLMQSAWEFYALACVIGLVQGGVSALSRSLFTRLIPADRAAELFGFYNMVGKSATIIGPVMMGWVGILTGSPRISILSLLILFIAGGILLMKLKIPATRPAD